MRLEDFDIAGEVNKGSFGVVYKAVRKSDGRVFALKVVKLEGMNRADREEAIDEARMLAQLNHPHVCKHFDSWIDAQNNLNIIMEMASKGNLSMVVKAYKAKTATLPEDMVWRYLIQSLLGLQHIHSKRIIHRDIKALNLFIDAQDNIKIGDLGIARALGDGSAFARSLVGTPYYYSPELCEDKPYNEKSDMWALGVVMYECCMGRFPFEAQNEGALIRKILAGKYDPIPAGKYSGPLIALVHSLLTFRYQSRPDTSQLLSNTMVMQKARALGVDLNPKPTKSTEDVPTYERPGGQGQQGYTAAAPSPSGAPGQQQQYGQQYGQQQSQYGQQQQQYGQQQPQYGGGGGVYQTALVGPQGGQQQYGQQAQQAGSHPFDLHRLPSHSMGRQGRSNGGRPVSAHMPAAGAVAYGGSPGRPQSAHPFINQGQAGVAQMAGDFGRMNMAPAVGSAEFRRIQEEQEGQLRANAYRGHHAEVGNIINAGYEQSSPRPSRVDPSQMVAAGAAYQVPAKNQRTPAPFAMHFSGSQQGGGGGGGGGGRNTAAAAMQQLEEEARHQEASVWTARHEPPQYGRKRNPDLMVTGPTLRGTSARAGGGAPYAAARMADDATTYVSSTTWQQR
ncbi:hypothetical protein FOA52_003296 [Chlamydomonas sp. UWO 241]|nr:hypothetical protein FOA52_003296 [Chlamydomonas sp. UWO 241]